MNKVMQRFFNHKGWWLFVAVIAFIGLMFVILQKLGYAD